MDDPQEERRSTFLQMRTAVKTYGPLMLWHFAKGSIQALGENLIDLFFS